MTDERLEPADWPAGHGVVQVAPESTGVCRRPVLNPPETRYTPLVADARHIGQARGRKTDVQDGRRIAQLLRPGLLRAGPVPPRPTRAPRDLTRQRTRSVRQRATRANRLQKVLGDADIKPAGVATDPPGASGRARIAAGSDPAQMAEPARRRMRPEIPRPLRALTGRPGGSARDGRRPRVGRS